MSLLVLIRQLILLNLLLEEMQLLQLRFLKQNQLSLNCLRLAMTKQTYLPG